MDIEKEHLTIECCLPGEERKTKKHDGLFYLESERQQNLSFKSLPTEE